MILSAVVIAIVALLGYLWLSRGFFGSFLNMVCCIFAGAIALGVWEPIAYMLLAKMPGNGAFAGAIWGASLALPFAVVMAILRAAVDKAVPSNLHFEGTVNMAGGAVCGLVSGVICTGILVISISFLRFPTEFMGYKPADHGPNGSVQVSGGLILPTDKITASFYRFVSKGTLATSTPLARYYPDLEYAPHVLRVSYGDGKARNTISNKDFEVWRRFTTGGKDTRLADLLADDWAQAAQNVTAIDQSQFPANSRLEGFVINFQPSAREKSGSVVIGNAQIRLIVASQGDDPEYKTIHPITVICQAQSDKRMYGRFRFDAPETFVGSVGGASETRMGFEFPVPDGFQPIALYVKNTRVAIPESAKPVVYANRAERDKAIRSGAMFDQPAEEDSISVVNRAQAGPVRPETNLSLDDLGIRMSNNIGYIIQRGTERNLSIDDKFVVEGQEIYSKAQLDKGRGIDRSLQITDFQPKKDTIIVQIDVTLGKRLSWLGQAAASVDMVLPPQLVDSEGTLYEPVGFVYEDQQNVTIRFNRGEPIRALTQVPSLSRTRQDQSLRLIFDVSQGVKLVRFQIGGKVLREFEPPVPVQRG